MLQGIERAEDALNSQKYSGFPGQRVLCLNTIPNPVINILVRYLLHISHARTLFFHNVTRK